MEIQLKSRDCRDDDEGPGGKGRAAATIQADVNRHWEMGAGGMVGIHILKCQCCVQEEARCRKQKQAGCIHSLNLYAVIHQPWLRG